MSDPNTDRDHIEIEAGEAGCTWCERTSGAVLVVGAVALLYIGLDLITGGWLSRAFTSGVIRAADVIDPGTGELDGQAATVGTDEPPATT